MEDEEKIRRLLVDSCHSSVEAKRYFDSRITDAGLLETLVRIAADEEDRGGDAPMQAAYYASKFSRALLVQHEPVLLDLVSSQKGYAGHVALALGKTGSIEGRRLLEEELGEGTRVDAWLFQKALAQYEKN